MAISTLGYAILTLLARASLSGYAIAREMRKPHSFFFGHAQYSQIYPELTRLEQAHLVTSRIIDQQGKPDKKEYTLTPLGMQMLQQWVVAPTQITEVRSEFLIKAHSLWLADSEQALAQFHVQLQQHLAILAQYEADLTAIEQRYGIDIARLQTPPFGDYVTVQMGVSYERAYIEWLRRVIALLEQRAPQ